MMQYAGIRYHTMLLEPEHRELLGHMLTMTINDDNDDGVDGNAHDDD